MGHTHTSEITTQEITRWGELQSSGAMVVAPYLQNPCVCVSHSVVSQPRTIMEPPTRPRLECLRVGPDGSREESLGLGQGISTGEHWAMSEIEAVRVEAGGAAKIM